MELTHIRLLRPCASAAPDPCCGQVCGAIGNCSSLGKKTSHVAETEIGQGMTSAWAIGGLDEATTIALYFEVTNQANAPVQHGQQRYLQLLTTYQHSSGQYRYRVTTLSHTWADTTQLAEIARRASLA